ncbi:MAG: LysR family transcriptional regulator [Pelagimonas sp.]|jgi:DNA-binding transcriptional LysR family regulator|nr:LysR family transcriptional regulator [Pelagimonas sp.]
MPSKDLSLKGLELFQICANKGSLQAAAQETGLSISTVSHHLRALETHLGVPLFDHTRRPMVLTPTGQVFLRNIDAALLAIRKAKAEATASDITEASLLRFGTIEDFDSEITPDLAVYMAERMPRCDFLFHTGSSHEIFEMLHNRRLDLAVTTSPPERLRNLNDRPLLRDPYVIVLPVGTEHSLPEIVEGQSPLPLLRYSDSQIIARQIESHLRRLGISAPHRFEFGSNQALMAMVAAGSGWAITTPLLFSRVKRLHPRLRMHRFPGKGFSRTITLVSTPDCSQVVTDVMAQRLRMLLTKHALAPLHASAPWLADGFVLIDDTKI